MAACIASPAFFFLVGISAFRSLDAAALATAAGLGFDTDLAAAGADARDADFAIGRRSSAGALGSRAAFADAALAVAVSAGAGLAAALTDLVVDVAVVAGLAGVDLAVAGFCLARFVAALIAERDSGFAGRATFVADALFAEAGLADLDTVVLVLVVLTWVVLPWVVLTGMRALVRDLDAAALVDRPRDVAAALAFGGMVKPLLTA